MATINGNGIANILKEHPDPKDFTLMHLKNALSLKETDIKPQVDLRQYFSTPITQGVLDSCTACSIGSAMEYDLVKQQKPFTESGDDTYIPSTLFIYYNERLIEGNADKNAPVYMKDSIKSLVKYGACSSAVWPYDIPKFKQKPPAESYSQAKNFEATSYYQLSKKDNLIQLKECLSLGLPFAFVFMIPESWEDNTTPVYTTGQMQMPAPDEKRVGAHAVLAVGYDDSKEVFIIRNSWGPLFGDEGYFYMPYDFMGGSYPDNGENTENTFSLWALITVGNRKIGN